MEKCENRNVLMNELTIGSSTIYDIKKQKDELIHFVYQSLRKKVVSGLTLRKSKLDQLNHVLHKWAKANHAERKRVIVEKGK